MLVSAFVTLFVITDPPGLAPIFIGLTRGANKAERHRIAIQAIAIATCVLAVFALIGKPLLDALGITIHAFRVAGGLLLFWIAFEMVFEKRGERKSDTAAKALEGHQASELAAFPLAVPLIAGPGAITAVILLAGTLGGEIVGKAVIIGLVAVVMAITLAFLLTALWVDRYIGDSARSVATRLLGVILAALAVQFVADGVTALVKAA
ncbi:MAG: MarC family protein [Flavobacteriaceae bacterium]